MLNIVEPKSAGKSGGARKSSVLHESARRYAKAGIKVFPCLLRSKIPAVEGGFKAATEDLGQIDRWWTENPDYNVATCPHDSGWTVVDEEAGTDPAWLKGRPLPETYTVQSPRGGTHKFYEGECRSTVKKLGPTIDTRGVGGYVLLPPSIFFDEETGKTGQYKVLDARDPADLPDWIPKAFAKTEHEPSPAAGEPVTEAHLRELLSHIDPDAPRDDWRNIVAGIHATPLIDDPDASKRRGLAVAWSRGELDRLRRYDVEMPASYTNDADVVKVFKTMPPKPGGVGYGTIFAAAKAAGYNGPPARQSMAETWAHIVAQLDQPAPANDDSELVSRRASDIPMEKIEWLWLNRIPRGKCGLLAGDPKLGKTTVLLDITARVSRGAPWPCREGTAPRGSVIYFTGEDDPADTLIPRLVAAGADLTKIHFVEAVKDENGNRTFHLQSDLARLERKIAGVGDVALVIFDPISSYFGKTDTYRNTEVRGVLEPVVKMAARCKIAIICNTHLAKGSKGRANMRILDSVAMTAAVRSVYMVIEDASDPKRRLFLPSGETSGHQSAD